MNPKFIIGLISLSMVLIVLCLGIWLVVDSVPKLGEGNATLHIPGIGDLQGVNGSVIELAIGALLILTCLYYNYRSAKEAMQTEGMYHSLHNRNYKEAARAFVSHHAPRRK